jgi:hypothetical protein
MAKVHKNIRTAFLFTQKFAKGGEDLTVFFDSAEIKNLFRPINPNRSLKTLSRSLYRFEPFFL